jgi:hypothetical protein
MSDSDLIRCVYRQFNTGPLSPDLQSDLYVDLEKARGNMHPTDRLQKVIEYAEGAPTCQVLAGHKGSGKSTELYRLKQQLEAGSSPFFVAYVQTTLMDLNDVDFPDVLIVVVQQLAAQVKERAGVDLRPGYFRKAFERLKEVLTSDVSFDHFELGGDLLKISGEIKASPSARAEVRKLLEPDTGNLLNAANDVIGQAVLELTAKGKPRLVVLVDDLDKMIVRPRDDGGSTDEYLFVRRAAQLTAFRCHVVYTMPLALAYSHHEAAIRANYGDEVPVVPMTKVRRRPPDDGPYEDGVELFRRIIARRLEKAEAKESEVFHNDRARARLIALSGGQPDELMRLMRGALIGERWPIDETAVERLAVNGRREYSRLLRAEHWPIIDEVRRTGNYVPTKETDSAFRELLTARAVLQYVNDDLWYALNPMVADLTPPNRGISVP